MATNVEGLQSAVNSHSCTNFQCGTVCELAETPQRYACAGAVGANILYTYFMHISRSFMLL